jgi:hypothetical protein
MRIRGLLLAAVVLLSLVWVGRSSAVHAQAQDAGAVDAAFKSAFLAGDLNRMFALYAPDAIQNEPFGIFTSSAAGRAGFETFLRQNPGLSASVSDSTVTLDTAVHRVAIASDPIRAAGVSRIWVIHTMVVFQGKIVAFAGILDLSDAETAKFALASSGH